MTIHFHTNFSPTFIFYFLYWNNSCSIYVDIGQAEIYLDWRQDEWFGGCVGRTLQRWLRGLGLHVNSFRFVRPVRSVK